MQIWCEVCCVTSSQQIYQQDPTAAVAVPLPLHSNHVRFRLAVLYRRIRIRRHLLVCLKQCHAIVPRGVTLASATVCARLTRSEPMWFNKCCGHMLGLHMFGPCWTLRGICFLVAGCLAKLAASVPEKCRMLMARRKPQSSF